MGVFDGHSSLSEDGSTAELAKLIDAPVVLIADASKVARSVAAEVLGYQQFDPDLRIAGVVLNGVGGPRHLEFCQPQVEATTGLPVLGYMPRRPDLVQPERHLGLIPTVEGTVARQWYDTLIEQVEETIDLDAILRLAAGSNSPPAPPVVYPAEEVPKRARIGVAQDMAFSFYYQDSLDLLEAWGAEIVPFSPIEDEGLPPGVGGLYLGGGFPELFARELSENRPMHTAIRNAVDRGVPVYAECGGLMYLGDSLADQDGVNHPMIGLIPAASGMSNARLTLGYREVEGADRRPAAPGGTAGAGGTSSTGQRWSGNRTRSSRSTVWWTRATGPTVSSRAASGHRTSTSTWAATRRWPSGSSTPAPNIRVRWGKAGLSLVHSLYVIH